MNDLFRTVCQRYYISLLSDFFRVMFLILQSLVITVLFIVVFRDSGNSETFRLLLVITSVWLGLINSCQEIVKEKEMFRMERRFGITAHYFVLSKLIILSLVSFIQVSFMLVGLYLFTRVGFSLFAYLLVLFISSVSSSALGLLISSISRGPAQALAIAPIITIPQILFNDILIKSSPLGMVEFLKSLMISNWALLFIENLENSLDFKLILYIMIIMTYAVVYYLFSILILRKAGR